MSDTATGLGRRHSVQFYTSDEFFMHELERSIGRALRQGASAIVIATRAHQEALAERLERAGLDLASIRDEGRYEALDAGELLSRFISGDAIDESRFFDVASEVIARASAASRMDGRRVVAFGEMVALLWAEGKSATAVQLEKLWNRLSRTYSLSLCCAYPMQGFRSEKDLDSFLAICGEHSLVTAEGDSEQPHESIVDYGPRESGGRSSESFAEWGNRDDRFRQFVNAVQDYAVFMLDPEGRIRSWNPGAERIAGYSRSEILGSHFSRLYPEEQARRADRRGSWP